MENGRALSLKSVASCVSMGMDWTRLLCSSTILAVSWFNVGVFSLGYLRSIKMSYKLKKIPFIMSYRVLAVLSWKERKSIFRLTYFCHHVTMSGCFPSCSLHLFHSCWKRLLRVVSSKRFVFIFHRTRPRCRTGAFKLTRSRSTARWFVNSATTVCTSCFWPLRFDVTYSPKACRSMRGVMSTYGSERDVFPHSD